MMGFKDRIEKLHGGKNIGAYKDYCRCAVVFLISR